MKKILVMDKDEVLLSLIGFILESEGFMVEQVNSLNQLNQSLKSFIPHVILLDIITPFTEEADFCQQLKIANQTKDIPVIVLSTSKQVTDAKDLICANDFVSKPFDIHDLVNRVKIQLAA